jgi:hypothetical protein
MISGGITYQLEGKKHVNEGQEVYILRSFTDLSNYVSVEYSVDEDLQRKFFFRLVKNDLTLNRSKITIETKNNQIHTIIDFIEGSAKGKYELNEATDGTTRYIYVQYEVSTYNDQFESGTIKVLVTTSSLGINQYEYIVSPSGEDDSYEYYGNREDDFEDEDEDDDSSIDDEDSPNVEDSEDDESEYDN